MAEKYSEPSYVPLEMETSYTTLAGKEGSNSAWLARQKAQNEEIIRVLEEMLHCVKNNVEETGLQMVYGYDEKSGHVWTCYLQFHGAP